MANPTSKLTRMRLELEEYELTVEYLKGKDNLVADALSRLTIVDLKEMHRKILMIQKIIQKTEKHLCK